MISTAAFLALALKCAPDVAPDTMLRIVKTESGFNEWAIGVVGTPLKRQPTTREEALAAITQLHKANANFSIGLAQINKQYFSIKDIEEILSPCTNLKMGSDILKDCYVRALKQSQTEQEALKKSFSCYYSGNYKRGFIKESNGTSYVDRVVSVTTNGVKVPSLDGDIPVEHLPSQERPTYDAWDVLHQYPKYNSPAVQASNESVPDKKEEELSDVK